MEPINEQAPQKSAPALHIIPLTHIVPSPTNPRRRFTGIEELADSIRENGVLQPILVRPHATQLNAYELVAGERRWRASQMAHMLDIVAICREMTDREVLETQVIENNQRVDVHPLEEAEGFARLSREHGQSAEEIAARIGRSPSYVYARMKLTALSPACVEAFLDSKIGYAVALILARVPVARLQDEALKELCDYVFNDGEGPTPAEARRLVRERYMLRIADAPFNTDDPALIPEAGPCRTCPKATGAQRVLFSDFEETDLCTDPDCYTEKRERDWRNRAASAKEHGQRVLSDADSKKVFHDWGKVKGDSDFVDLNEEDYDPATGKRRSWKKLLGKQCPPIVLARDTNGGVHELVEKTAAAEVYRAKAKDSDKQNARGGILEAEAEKERQDKERRETLLNQQVDRICMAQLVDTVEATGLDVEAWRALALGMVSFAWEEVRRAVARRRGVEKGDVPVEFLRDACRDADEKVLTGIALEIVATRDHETFRAMCDLYQVDRAKVTKAIEASLKGKAKGKAAKGADDADPS